jgi:antitoxin (DNA-binding transcriptional repressor) of toxin-antitoxin stability system
MRQAIEDEEMGRREAIAKGEAPKVNNWRARRAKLVERARAGNDITTEHGLRVARRRESEALVARSREHSRASMAAGTSPSGRSAPPAGWSGPVPVNVRSEAE